MKEKKEIIREMIKHENELTNHRLNWMIATQGLMLVSVANVITKTQPESTLLVFLVSTIGVFVSLATVIGLRGSGIAVRNLMVWYKEHQSDEEGSDPPVIGFRRDNESEEVRRVLRNSPFGKVCKIMILIVEKIIGVERYWDNGEMIDAAWVCIPIFFAFAWSLMILFKIFFIIGWLP
ncbi:hypothetical protein [Marichromatium gracile]|uniref:hypothetical protein n=1 Tax=Marichromatium gracile TaxID=1048 RepID=UPI00128FE71A|nr:hypothetical protein [Marichromatium gracile]